MEDDPKARQVESRLAHAGMILVTVAALALLAWVLWTDEPIPVQARPECRNSPQQGGVRSC